MNRTSSGTPLPHGETREDALLSVIARSGSDEAIQNPA